MWNGSSKPFYAQSLVYVYCVRTFGVPTLTSLPSHDQEACKGLIAKLVPFLTDSSTLLLQDIGEAHSSVQSRLDDKVRSPWFRLRGTDLYLQLSPRLLSDVYLILRPRTIVEVVKQGSLKTQASVTNSIDALTFLSDLSNLFEGSSRTPKRTKTRPSRVLHKITFYAAQIATCPTEALRTLAEDLNRLANYMETTEPDEREAVPENKITLPFSSAVERDIDSGLGPARQRSRPTIEELS